MVEDMQSSSAINLGVCLVVVIHSLLQIVGHPENKSTPLMHNANVEFSLASCNMC